MLIASECFGLGCNGLLPKYRFRLPESVLNKSKACER